MASASSDSGLWRTTSGSTASSSGDYAHKSTGPISAAGAIDRTLNGHANRSSLHDHGNARRTPSKRIRRRKAKVVKNDDSAPSDSGAASCLPGFVAATSLTSRQSPSAVKLVATNIDVKGKGRTVDDELVMDSPTFRPIRPESTSLAPGHSLQASAIPAEDIEGDQTAPVDDSTVFPAGEASSEDSAASSTDELPYAPSPTVSPHVTPQAKVGLRALSVTPKSSPFKAPITGFEFLAARNNTLFGTSSWISKSNEPQTTGLGIAGKGLEALPVKKEGETTFQLKAPQNDLNIIGPTKKKVASSPLTWSTDHKVLDAATLGSPTLGSMKESEDQEELARNAITKAAFSVNQATILQELAKRKAQRKLELEANALAPSVTLTISRSDEPEVKPLARNNDENENKDGVKRRDMATSHWKPLPASSDVDLMANGKANGEAAASSAPERSPLLGGGATSATADAEEEVDDGASEASNTSFLIHAVVRDGDMASGWEALDSSYDTTEKKRVRLENAIYELDKRHRPSPAVIAARREMLLAIRKRLNWMLKDWAPDFQYRLETFGSTKYGLDTDSSDLDLCIVDPHRPDGFRNACDLYDLSEPINGPKDINASTEEDEENIPSTPFSRHKRNKKWAQADTRKKMTLGDVYDVHRLADLLRKMGHQEIIAIPNAVVPIIKFKSREGIKADMVSVHLLDNSAMDADINASSRAELQ